MKKRLSGVVVPTITPFYPNGDLDEEALRPYLDFLAGRVHGISVCAIYGSGILMRLEQRKRVAEIAVEVCSGRVPVSVFVGAADTETAIDLARHAEQAGASAVSCVQPIYYRQVDEAIFRHYQAIIDAVDIPVYIYDSPLYAGNQISLAVVDRLAQAGLAGIITGAATYGIEHVWSVLRNTGRELDIWSIRDGLALPAMMMGAAGFESGVGNFFPELVMDLYQAIAAKDYDTAKELQTKALQLRDISHGYGRNIPTLHALVGLRGLATGHPRRPFYLLSEEEMEDLKQKLSSLRFTLPFGLPS